MTERHSHNTDVNREWCTTCVHLGHDEAKRYEAARITAAVEELPHGLAPLGGPDMVERADVLAIVLGDRNGIAETAYVFDEEHIHPDDPHLYSKLLRETK